jgi:hypothetical protein
MTTGALIFAYNNDAVDYVSMAAWTAQRVQQYLDIPVTLITNSEVNHSVFDQIIHATSIKGNTRYYPDYADSFTWYNMDRCDALELSPYDRTLVIDADYVVNGDNLKPLLDHGPDFVCHRTAYDAASQQCLNPTFGAYAMPQWWATVMMFTRTSATHYIFDSMRMVRENWPHYCDIYHIHRGSFRNDYALSIALGLVSGHSLVTQDIPWGLLTVTHEHRLEQLEHDLWRVTFQEKGRLQYLMLSRTDFHAMGKRHLGDIIVHHS